MGFFTFHWQQLRGVFVRTSAACRLNRAGGVTTRIYLDENRVSPVVLFDTLAKRLLRQILPGNSIAFAPGGSTTRPGKPALECLR